MSQTKHTQEPWEYHAPSKTITEPIYGMALIEVTDTGASNDFDADISRAVECVNACEGIKNPTSIIIHARELYDGGGVNPEYERALLELMVYISGGVMNCQQDRDAAKKILTKKVR